MKVNPGAGRASNAVLDTSTVTPKKEQRPAKKPENVFANGPATIGEVGGTKSTDRLRLAVSGAVNRVNLALLDQLSAGGRQNGVLAGVLTATQFAQVMPALSPDQQTTMLAKLGLSDLTPQEFITGARADAARFNEGLGAETKLNQASFSYVQQGKELNPAIQGGPIRQIDFATEGAEKINSDISTATNGMIPTLVEQDAVADLQVFLAAAAYIESPWGGSVSFDPENTTQARFDADGAGEQWPDMMVSDVTEQRLAAGKGYEAVYLPNGTAGNLGTIYIKPTEGTLADFIKAQGDGGIQNIIGDLTNPVAASTQTGAVRIPKTDIDFKPSNEAFLQTLQSLGLPSSAALLADGSVDITQAAYVGKAQTSEEGIKIAAAQGFGGLESMRVPPEPIVFDGNRSMLQLVVKDGQVLFFNPIVNPAGE